MMIQRVLMTALLIGTGLAGIGTATYGIHATRAQSNEQGLQWSRHYRGRIGYFCDGDINEKLTRMTAYVDTELKLTDDQRLKLDAVTEVLQNSGVEMICPDPNNVDLANPLDKLNRLETLLENRLTIVQQVQQPLQVFYESLSDDQQDTLNRLMRDRHHRR